MMTILFLLAVLFAIPTSGVSLLAFLVVFFARGYLRAKVRMHHANEVGALRDLENRGAQATPSWMNTSKEREFFDAVTRLAHRKSVPVSYLMHGFISPQSSAVLFAYAANMEARGSSFSEQQMGACDFVVDAWRELEATDKQIFLNKDRLGMAGLAA